MGKALGQGAMASRRPTSSTGDLQNNLEKLRYELQHSKYTGPIDIRILRKGSPADLLPLVHFALLGLSRLLHDELVAKGYDLFAKTDIRFMEAAFKLLRNEFDYQPAVSEPQLCLCNNLWLCMRVLCRKYFTGI